MLIGLIELIGVIELLSITSIKLRGLLMLWYSRNFKEVGGGTVRSPVGGLII